MLSVTCQKVIAYGSDEVADRGKILLKDIYTNLGPRLQPKQVRLFP